ncbi:MAG: hypothetical protein ACFFDW_00770 [Candidatus Thorarchaeota archaeon]
MRFSKKKEHRELLHQNDFLTIDTRKKFWDIINQFHLSVLGLYEFQGKHDKYFLVMEKFYHNLWEKFFYKKIEQMTILSQSKIFNAKLAFQYFQEHFLLCPWFTVFDILEEIDSYNRRYIRANFDFGKYINNVLDDGNQNFIYINHQIERKEKEKN